MIKPLIYNTLHNGNDPKLENIKLEYLLENKAEQGLQLGQATDLKSASQCRTYAGGQKTRPPAAVQPARRSVGVARARFCLNLKSSRGGRRNIEVWNWGAGGAAI